MRLEEQVKEIATTREDAKEGKKKNQEYIRMKRLKQNSGQV